MRIDAHQHFWSLSRGDYRWLTPDEGELFRDFSPADLEPELAAARIERTVLVQATDTVAETLWLLDLARSVPWVAGVVGWVDLEARTAPGQIERLARDPMLLGVRPMLQDLPDVGWITRPTLGPAVEALCSLGLSFDALVRVDHLPHLRRFMERHPDLRVVLDHGAKPVVATGVRPWPSFVSWREHMAGIARETTACCKLSGLATEATGDWAPADLRPYLDVLLESFGPHRLLWGSDWPVVESAGGYAAWWSATGELLADLHKADRERILGGSATAFYRLGRRGRG